MRCTRSGRGTFPLRKPGMRTLAARSDAACSIAWCRSCAGTSTVSLTLFSGSSSTCAGTLAIEPDEYRAGVDVETAILLRRTHKRYGAEPVDEATLVELLELARHAPNHKLTNPWRFRVLGPATRARIEELAGENEAAKL